MRSFVKKIFEFFRLAKAEPMSTPGNRLKTFRKLNGLKQSDVAAATGYSASLLSEIEKNKKTLTERLSIALRAAYRVNERWLRDGDGPMMAKEEKPAVAAGRNGNVVALDSHQSLVTRFQQRELAEEINHILIEIEALEPNKLAEVKATLVATRNFLIEQRGGRSDGETAPKKTDATT